ncbi:TetR family transcriptional regulator [Promicromonospora sp. AC04]|uniref:TetR/AcrR family transcriptional regulator n=1 Tax=Promicromonospora sp. AC04 TaxID=2135723 RepID=UPI000D34E626|nr:TetR/AcrR family transcriptional regulator [Promicromonospora sp. AC04]PUB21570.1 TetR family transcriptional regulator [Promicromonospora sp. AC04]
MTTEPAAEPAARRGRKRSEEGRIAILTAAYEQVAEVGYHALTIEGIAARAGSSKRTVYRWWSHKADVLLEALSVKAELRISTTDHGSWAADLSAFLRDSYELGRVPGVAPVLRALMAEAQIDPGFGQRFREGFLARRRAALATLTDRAARRGDLPPIDPGLIADLVFGTIWYWLLARDEIPADAPTDALTALLSARPEANPGPENRDQDRDQDDKEQP